MTAFTLKKTCVRIVLSSVPLALLFTMTATATNGQAIGIKPQADANARNVSTSDGKPSANPKSSIRPDKNAGAVTVEGGSYRFVTGSQGKRSYRFKTPYGALDVRG